jgi:type I restriction enzyme S subunit
MDLGGICELIVDCEHKTASTQTEGHPSIRTPNIGRGFLLLDGVNRVSEETYNLWTKRAEPRYGDLIMAREAPVGNVAMVPRGLRPCLGQRTLLIRPMRSKVDSRYLVYLLVGDEVQNRIHAMTNGVTVPHLNMEDVRSLALPPLPSLPTQQKIAAILSAYDDLIENNLLRIKILEEMAQNLYREWFVKFRFPGHEHTHFTDSALGPIPEKWEVKRLDELAGIRGGKQLGKEEIREVGKFPVFGGNGIQGYSDKATHKGFVIAFGRVGAYCGAIHWSYGGAWLNNNSLSIVPLKHDELILHQLLDSDFTSLRGGAAQPFISNTALAGIELVFPGDALAAQFCSIAHSLHLERVTLERSTTTLRRTRDLLLPRLISGEVDVSELDIAVPEEAMT